MTTATTMLPSKGVRWTRNAVRTSQTQAKSKPQGSRLYSIATRPATRRPQCSVGDVTGGFALQNRQFSSTPLQRWSLSSLWANTSFSTSPLQSSSSSDFATSTSNEFAQFHDPIPKPSPHTQGLLEESVPPPSSTLETAPPTIVPSDDVAPPHHGTPLTGPETLLPDPVTHHESVNDLANPIENIPEHIGYLKELGLDYGWGTSSPMQMLLEYIHIYGGIPWYASAMLSAVMLRLLFLRRQMRASNSTAKWQQMKPIHEPITEELKAARLEGDSFKSAQLTKKLLPLRKEADLKLSNMVIPLVGQLCLGFGLWRNLRGMAELPVPALEHEKCLWLSDLTVRDHTFGIALIQGISMYMVMGQNAQTNATSPEMARFQEIMRRAFPVVGFLVCAFQPAIVQLYFVTSSLLNLTFTSLIKNNRFRDWAGLARFPPPSKPLNPGPGVPTVSATYAKAAEAAGINLAPSPSATARSPVASAGSVSSKQNISSIDRMVDSFKSTFSGLTSSINKQSNKKAGESIAQKRAKKEKEREDQYDSQRRREIEADRIRRNEQAKRVFEREREREAEAEEQRRMMEDDEGEEVDVERTRKVRGRRRH